MHLASLLAASAAVLLCWAGGRGAAAGHSHRCPWPLGKWPFDSDRFSGEWFVVLRPDLGKPEDVTCRKLKYSSETHGNETRVSIKMHLSKDGEPLAAAPEARARHMFGRPQSGSVLQAVWRRSPADKWNGVFKMNVLATDYDTYAVVVACKQLYHEKEDSFDRLIIPQVWSREPSLDPAVLAVLRNVVSGLDVDESSLKEETNTGC